MLNMHQYVNDKIKTKLRNSSSFSFNQFESSVDKLLNEINVNLQPEMATDFKDCVIGWITFCKIIEQLASNNQEFTVENFSNIYFNMCKNEVKQTRNTGEVDESLMKNKMTVEEEKEYAKYLIENVAEVINFSDDFDVDELTEVGLREVKFIDSNTTSLDAVEIQPQNTMPVIYIQNINDEILSPYTGTNRVCQVNSCVYMDLETEELFKVYIDSKNS